MKNWNQTTPKPSRHTANSQLRVNLPQKNPQWDEFTVHVVKPYDNRFVLVMVAKIQVCRICEKITITDIVKTK